MRALGRILLLAAATALGAVVAVAAYPERPIKLIVSGGAGSVSDIRARWIAARLGTALGEPVVVENQAGGNGIIGTRFVARSAPDGHTLVLVHMGNLIMNPLLYADVGYDPFADFAPVSRISTGYGVLTVNPQLPVRTLDELIKLAKQNPGKLNYGSTGIGGPPWMMAELFKRMAGIDVTHVQYKGGGELLTDLIAGRIDYWFEGSLIQMPHIKAGKLRPIVVTAPERLAYLPDVPTITEAGLPGYEFQGWTGIAAPAGTPRAIIDRLNLEMGKVLRSREAVEWFTEQGNTPVVETPEEFAAFIRAQQKKWGALVREANIKPQ